MPPKAAKCLIASYFTTLAKRICNVPVLLINLNFLVKSKMAAMWAAILDNVMDPQQLHNP